jgi:hypothetical protein
MRPLVAVAAEDERPEKVAGRPRFADLPSAHVSRTMAKTAVGRRCSQTQCDHNGRLSRASNEFRLAIGLPPRR